MARIIGNHDTTRFISEANGDAAGDPWTRPAVQPTDHVAYARQTMALALIMTLPGLPVLYYGDETGLAGGSDPDCRRVMPTLPDLTADAIMIECCHKLAGIFVELLLQFIGDDQPLWVAFVKQVEHRQLEVTRDWSLHGAAVRFFHGESF